MIPPPSRTWHLPGRKGRSLGGARRKSTPLELRCLRATPTGSERLCRTKGVQTPSGRCAAPPELFRSKFSGIPDTRPDSDSETQPGSDLKSLGRLHQVPDPTEI